MLADGWRPPEPGSDMYGANGEQLPRRRTSSRKSSTTTTTPLPIFRSSVQFVLAAASLLDAQNCHAELEEWKNTSTWLAGATVNFTNFTRNGIASTEVESRSLGAMNYLTSSEQTGTGNAKMNTDVFLSSSPL